MIDQQKTGGWMDIPIRQSPLLLIESALSPEQRLAAAVFSLALADASDPPVPGSHQHSPMQFLLEDDDLFLFWASVADVNAGPFGRMRGASWSGDHPALHDAVRRHRDRRPGTGRSP